MAGEFIGIESVHEGLSVSIGFGSARIELSKIRSGITWRPHTNLPIHFRSVKVPSKVLVSFGTMESLSWG